MKRQLNYKLVIIIFFSCLLRTMRILIEFLLLTSFIFEASLAANCDEDLLGENDLPDSAFTATSNSESVEQLIAGVSPGVDHSAKTARYVTIAYSRVNPTMSVYLE